MAREQASDSEQAFSEALEHVRAAIAILDSVEAPAQIAAHLDLALCQLLELVGAGTRANARLNSDPDLH
jgi:hypothetical protein